MPMAKTRDGTELYVNDWGRGPAVVLIHGWPLSADSWADQALALANAGNRVIFYDRRGLGRSSQPWSGYDYDTLASDLEAVIEATDAINPALVGFSMGGGEVARYVGRGGKARAAVLISAVTPYMEKSNDNPHGTPAAMFETIKDGLKQDRPKFLGGFMRDFYGVSVLSHPVSDETVQASVNDAMRAGLKGTLDCVTAFGQTDFRPDMAAFKMPTLIIHGTADKTVPIDAAGRAAARLVPGSKLIELDGPHGLLATHKDEVSKALVDFLAH